MKLCSSPSCTNGYVFDQEVMKLVECPLCSELRAERLSQGIEDDGVVKSVSEVLGFRRIFSGLSLDLEDVLTTTVYNELDVEVRDAMREILQKVISSLSSSQYPETSMLFYLGSKADIELFSYYLLGSAYKAGMVTHPFVTPPRLRSIKQSLSQYDDLLKADVVVATYSPAIREDGYLMEDLLKQRAFEGKSTYLVLTDGAGINSLISRLCSEDGYSRRTCLYVGIPNLSGSDEVARVKRVNRAIRNSNKLLKTKTPEVELVVDNTSSSSAGLKGIAKTKSFKSGEYNL